MAFHVVVTDGAQRDIDDIYRFIEANTGPIAAEKVLGELERRVASLVTLPERGNVPKELQVLGRTDYRELHYKPYRIFYRLRQSQVFVVAVLDGRRDMNLLLRQRLIR